MAEAGTATKKAGGKGLFIVTLVVITVLAAVGGGVIGKMVLAKIHGAPPPPPPPEEVKPGVPDRPTIDVRELAPMVTNLAYPPTVRARLQIAIVYDKKAVENPNVLAAQISADTLAFMKTMTVAEVQGASGLQNLRDDLNERAAVRSQGKVREVIIEAFVVQ